MKAIYIANLLISSMLLSVPSTTTYIPPPTPPTISELVTQYAIKYEVKEKVMNNVIKCESNFNPGAIGDGGKSFGLSQIHLPSNPTVLKEQALNPEFAIEFLAKGLASGQGSKWTCYRMIYGV